MQKFRPRIGIPRKTYSWRLEEDNVEKVKAKVYDLAEWVDQQFRNEANMIDWTDESKTSWRVWLATQTEEVRFAASLVVPGRKYVKKEDYTGTVYTVISYDQVEGTVTLTCDVEEQDRRVQNVDPKELVEL